MQKALPALLYMCALLCAEDYALGPDSMPQPGTPKGVLTKHVLAPGKFYPGTPHNYSVYVPAQYNAAKPTPFMIFLDGSGAAGNNVRVPVVFDNLIARGELPAMIGIFIDPGVLPAVSNHVQNRFERVFEYDSLSDRYARFLIEELIPQVSKTYNLSKDPNDRGLSGVSTGAVGAFAAAWNRPDQFRRVLSFIGTFVSMKGADELPALIRKTEPKPLRVFLQAGRNDHIAPGLPYGTFYGGSWPINNRVMADAFEYSGYDVKLVLGDEGHNMKHGAAIMPEALRWLWREYPKPIVARPPAAFEQSGWDPRGKVLSTISLDKPWQQVGGDYKSVDGLTGDKDGNVYFSDSFASRIYKSGPDGKAQLFRENTSGARALRMGADGRLYASQPARKRIVSYGANGDEKLVAQNVEGNDLALTAKGGIYYSDSAQRTLGYIDPQRKNRIVYKGDDLAIPAGLALSPDQGMLVVTDSQSRYSWSFQIAADGGLINGEPFYRLEMPEAGWMSGVKSAMLDSIGQVYFSTAIGIQVCEANGRVAMILNKPESGTINGIAFAGIDWSWMYVAEGGKLFRRPTKMASVPAWLPVMPPKPPL
jgi:gluconolactonase